MVMWGVVMTLMGLVQNYHDLLVARFFLGLAEAGLYPGVAYYLTMWYGFSIKPKEILFVLIARTPIAGTVPTKWLCARVSFSALPLSPVHFLVCLHLPLPR